MAVGVSAGRTLEATAVQREFCILIGGGHAKDNRSAPEDSPVQYAA